MQAIKHHIETVLSRKKSFLVIGLVALLSFSAWSQEVEVAASDSTEMANHEPDTIKGKFFKKIFGFLSPAKTRAESDLNDFKSQDSIAMSFDGNKFSHNAKGPKIATDAIGSSLPSISEKDAKEKLKKLSNSEIRAIVKSRLSYDSVMQHFNKMEKDALFKSDKQKEKYEELLEEKKFSKYQGLAEMDQKDAKAEGRRLAKEKEKELTSKEVSRRALGLDLQKNKEKRRKIEKAEKSIDKGADVAREGQELAKSKDLKDITARYEANAEKYDWPSAEKYKNSYLSEYNKLSDSVKMEMSRLQAKQMEMEGLRPPVVTMENVTQEMLSSLDSLRPDFLMKTKLKNKSDSVQEVVYSARKLFRFGDYRELIVGLAGEKPDNFSLSPSLGFELGTNFSLGTGLLLDIDVENDFAMTLGYKAFARYDVVDNYFLQLENTHYFKGISNPTPAPEGEEVQAHSSMLAVGAGGIYTVTKSFGFTFQVLYQLIESKHSFNKSPLVIRAGINF